MKVIKKRGEQNETVFRKHCYNCHDAYDHRTYRIHRLYFLCPCRYKPLGPQERSAAGIWSCCMLIRDSPGRSRQNHPERYRRQLCSGDIPADQRADRHRLHRSADHHRCRHSYTFHKITAYEGDLVLPHVRRCIAQDPDDGDLQDPDVASRTHMLSSAVPDITRLC